jgi:hypothetical protein
MRTIQYKEWQVETYNEEPVTVDNYFKYDIIINKADGKYVMRISKEELWLSDAEGLLSGDEVLAQQALDNVIHNREYELDILKKFNSNKLTFKHGW